MIKPAPLMADVLVKLRFRAWLATALQTWCSQLSTNAFCKHRGTSTAFPSSCFTDRTRLKTRYAPGIPQHVPKRCR